MMDNKILVFDDYFTKSFEQKVVLKGAEDAFEKLDRWKKQ